MIGRVNQKGLCNEWWHYREADYCFTLLPSKTANGYDCKRNSNECSDNFGSSYNYAYEEDQSPGDPSNWREKSFLSRFDVFAESTYPVYHNEEKFQFQVFTIRSIQKPTPSRNLTAKWTYAWNQGLYIEKCNLQATGFICEAKKDMSGPKGKIGGAKS